ncbi:MAG: branched-chain amino acid ABC transporter substrate-binding protein [Cupriavidus sp.]|jgi:branched-chain amino acid transport system substrate-binding protein|uniref:branched-chain amino acid ABC transporter substrate-binding protein n=1 Tax=Cupriavidus pauculus TaxID=82633 RepID=UPI000784CA40|nr:branched-chain amino acid ABC transporter substrate-binding protein [Cupriavidus pauculus]MBU64669.1 branched-chain amino acid ABC transporter substrate-binding protein [Cupriavidus sp.]KAB0604295.1 branched-chain amino acid ABC transporter substrate-binding protein [Cupriavidus pauculus]MBY4733835.1 branched-chain amino acid ABC transporter substrate-binding protein [Cupriavidus pauculus]MCM3606577.1 branched-chain amino acid ABC transporter substrate-binding protein [Cupriavidus pauculus]
MQFTFAKILPIAAAVALVAACGKKEEKPADAAASAPAAAAAPAASAGGETVVKIGHAAPLTGGIAHLGKDNENGARLAVEEVNKTGLEIGGKKIKLELVGEDDAADPKTGTAVAQKLVDAHVVAVVGHLNSGVSIPASKIYSDAGIVQISPSSTNPDYTKQGFKTTYRVVATDAQQGPALANYAAKSLNAKSVAIVDDATAYGKGLADEFEKTAKAAGVNVVAREATNDKATDFKAILTKIKGKKPDVIMYGGMDATGGPFAKQAKELGIQSKIVGGDGVCTDKVAELAGDAVSNIICSEAGLALSKMEQGADFDKRYQARFNAPVQIYAPFTYDAVMVIVDAMKRANSVEPAAILAEMPKTNYKGLIGNIAFDEKGDMKEGTITLYEYKDKKKTVLDVVKM